MISSSGIIKRGLAATAISALAVTGVPALTGTAHAAVGSVTTNAETAYDIDEFDGAPDGDITVLVKEANGTPTPAGQNVQYSYVRTPLDGGPADPATGFVNGGTTDADGKVNLAFVPPSPGVYTLTVRSSGSQVAAAPVTFRVGEAEIYWADGNSASSPVNGNDTYTGTLALTDNARTPLAGRAITVTYNNGAGNASFGPQTLPSVRVNAANATSETAANGTFTVSLTDPAAPAGAPESGTLTATAPEARDAVDDVDTTADARDTLVVNFEQAPVVKAIEVTTDNVFGGTPAPGKPVELDIKVTSEGATPAPGDDEVLEDIPVTVTVDKGFLTPDTQGPGINVDPTDLDLTAEQDDEGDLFGFYENLGPDEVVDTSDDLVAPATNRASVVATIEKDAGFNDDGLVTQNITVTAGGKSAAATVNYDSRNYLNLVGAAFRRDGGSATVPGAIDLKLYAADQFGNLVGDEAATIADDTPGARVDEENGGADTDYLNDNPSARASSSQRVKQTITATIQANTAVVNATGDPVFAANAKTLNATHVIDWGNEAGPGPGGPTAINAVLTGANNGGDADKLKVVAPKKANGAVVKLFKLVAGKKVPAGTKTLTNGRALFSKADKNGNGVTKYVAKVQRTSDTRGDRSNTRLVR